MNLRFSLNPALQRRAVSRQFSDNMANHLIWETGRAILSGRPMSAWNNMLTALRLHSPGVVRRSARVSNLRFITRRFKQGLGKYSV